MSDSEDPKSNSDFSDALEIQIDIQEPDNEKQFLLTKYFNIWRYSMNSIKNTHYKEYENISI